MKKICSFQNATEPKLKTKLTKNLISAAISHNLSVRRDCCHWQRGSGLQGLGRSHFGGFHAQEGRHGEERPAEGQRGYLQESRCRAGEVRQEDCQGSNHIERRDKHRHVDSHSPWINIYRIHHKTISILHQLVVNLCVILFALPDLH